MEPVGSPKHVFTLLPSVDLFNVMVAVFVTLLHGKTVNQTKTKQRRRLQKNSQNAFSKIFENFTVRMTIFTFITLMVVNEASIPDHLRRKSELSFPDH